MESTLLSATTTPSNFKSICLIYPHRFISFPTRPNELSTLRISKPLSSISRPSKSQRSLLTLVAFAGGAGESSAESLVDAIVLDVRGMACEGCVSSVKKILESQPQVSSVSVDLAKETAIIWPVAEAKTIPDWQNHLGENLAKNLSSCGFESNLQSSISS